MRVKVKYLKMTRNNIYTCIFFLRKEKTNYISTLSQIKSNHPACNDFDRLGHLVIIISMFKEKVFRS
jgi:hypothetical protein